MLKWLGLENSEKVLHLYFYKPDDWLITHEWYVHSYFPSGFRIFIP